MLGEQPYEESKLIELLANDSQYAFQLLYDRHRDRIYRVAMKFLKSPTLSQEVVQDVFLKLWFERRNIRPGQPLEAWLYTVAKNKLINAFRKLSREWNAVGGLTQDVEAEDTRTDHVVISKELQAVLDKAMSHLSKQQREVYRMAKLEGMSRTEIAEELNISALTVKTHLSRAVESVRGYLKSQGIVVLMLTLLIRNLQG